MKWGWISKCTRERPDSVMPLGSNVVLRVKRPPEPHRCRNWCYRDCSSWHRSITASHAHNLTPGHPDRRWAPGRCHHQSSQFCKDGKFFLPRNNLHSQHQMLIFCPEISLSDRLCNLFPSPWAIVGWTSFVLNSSAWDLLFWAAGSRLCKSLPAAPLAPEGAVGSF